MTKRIAITGATGFLGSAIARHFAADGAYRVRLLTRGAEPEMASVHPIEHYRYGLARPLEPEALDGCDAVVHCAHDFRPSGNDLRSNVNFRAARALVEANEAGPRAHLVFLSSLSAHEGATSEYGRVKAAAERFFDPERDTVLQAGLVIGPGGLFARMFNQVRRTPVVPLFYFGMGYIQTVWIDDVVAAVASAVEGPVTGVFQICHPHAVPLRAFYAGLLEAADRRALLVPLPGTPFYWALRALEAVGLSLPFTSDNVLGVKHLRSVDPSPSLRELGIEPSDFQASLRRFAASL